MDDTQASKLRGGGGRGNLRFSTSFSLPFLARSTQAIGPLWLLSFSLSNLVWQGGMRRISFGDLSVTKLGILRAWTGFSVQNQLNPGIIAQISTVEPRLTFTSLLRPVFLSPVKRPCINFLIKKALLQSPVNTANGHILKSQTVESLIILPRYYRHSFEIWKIKMPLTCQFYWTSNPRLFLYNCFQTTVHLKCTCGDLKLNFK